MFFRTPYNYDTDVASFRSGLDCSNDIDRTQQNFKDDCDINRMVTTFAKTGIIPGADIPAMEFKFDEVFDYQSAMNALIEADKAFMSLPSSTREFFHNDPQAMITFLSDSKNRDRAIELGLVNPYKQDGVIVKSNEPMPDNPPVGGPVPPPSPSSSSSS